MSRKLPSGVHAKHGSYYLVRANKWTRLCRVDEGEAALFTALAKHSERAPGTLAEIFPLYLAWATLKPATRRTYTSALQGILLHTFGHMRPEDLTSQDVAAYLERRKQQGAAVAGNRERAVLSSVYEFALRHRLAKANPCRGVRRNPEKPRSTYVTTEQLQAAVDRAPAHFGRVLAFAYATGMRMEDILQFGRDAAREDGLYWVESKTGKPNHMPWSPWLRSLVRDLEAHADGWAAKKPRAHGRLLTNRYGQPLTVWGIESGMARLNVEWTFRDLRAKAETDGRGVLGHVGQMQERYVRFRRLRPVA